MYWFIKLVKSPLEIIFYTSEIYVNSKLSLCNFKVQVMQIQS